MKFKILLIIFFVNLTAIGAASAQTNELSGWAAWFHTQRFNKHWGMAFDGHLRSSHHVGYLKTVLLRPSINYYFGNKNIALGYAYIGANSRNGEIKTFRPENRLFEQFTIVQPAGSNAQITHRLRLEQRFLGETTTQQSVFSQRLRYFARGVIPLNTKQAPFTQGTYLALQNELFVNVQNKDKVNKHFLDQNRAFVGIGHRFSKMVDLEAGYLNQYIKQPTSYTINHVVQVTLYTRFGNSK
ncbi:DUF2490 domain-containing protein [Mucilaginibacter auburnensis]|uniref:Uncharacterized protein DUF2490 n=1 Tax=Mucilaginibacter auburnensis TaxID=1457233 RepID=A0A2H9VSC1_9SPHI|nr:DUF2490 domain-containing protein [Mucilaginibacter auburnensis]PJJ83726.1 uncharacterized protein DUF2490 [Mucilaginibacter auburnensis]